MGVLSGGWGVGVGVGVDLCLHTWASSTGTLMICPRKTGQCKQPWWKAGSPGCPGARRAVK